MELDLNEMEWNWIMKWNGIGFNERNTPSAQVQNRIQITWIYMYMSMCATYIYMYVCMYYRETDIITIVHLLRFFPFLVER